jgi:epoxyqueuosine reductase
MMPVNHLLHLGPMPMTLDQEIKAYARGLGFDAVGITSVGPPPHYPAFAAWLAAGYHGEMAYLATRAAQRADPALLAPGATSIIVLAASYNLGPPIRNPVSSEKPGFSAGRIARYACSADYHEVLKRRLYDLDAFIRQRTGRITPGKACVDTAPLLERDFAAQAGLGFIGRNCCLITPWVGSWTLLAELLVPEALSPHPSPDLSPGPTPAREGERCGRCTRCLDACPTRALVAPYVLDARRCISYLTIELKGPIPAELRPLMGNWVFGCDVCQEVCPYNHATHVLPAGEHATDLLELLALDEAGFRARYRGTPMLRAKRRGLVRNACVAAGNSGDRALVPALISLLADPEPLVREHAAWALRWIEG